MESLPADVTTTSDVLLEVAGVTAGYGRRSVLENVSLHTESGEIVALLGHNGAGKTTLLRAVAGLLEPTAGDVRFGADTILGSGPAELAQRGIALVPQGHGVFPSLSIGDNLRLGATASRSSGHLEATREFIFELFPILSNRIDLRAGSLSGGQQQMVAISMALMAQPQLLLLDEPSTGLAPVLVTEVLAAVQRIRDELGTTVLVVEQNIQQVLRICERVYVIQLGRAVFEGTTGEFRARDWSKLF